MLSRTKERILNEAAAIGTFLLKGFRSQTVLGNTLPSPSSRGAEGSPSRARKRLQALALLPARQPGGHPRPPTEVPREVTLVGKAGRDRDFRERKLSFP